MHDTRHDLSPFARRLTGLVLALATLPGLASSAGAGMVCSQLDECPCVFEMVEATLGRGWVGISMHYDQGKHYEVAEVVPQGPAQIAGLAVGDRLLAMNGVPMSREHEGDLAKIYQGMVPDSKLTYTIERDGETHEITVTLGRLPEKILTLVLGQQLLESYQKTTGKKVLPSKAPPAPEPPGPKKPPKAPRGDKPQG